MEQGTSSFGDYRLDQANRFIQDRLVSHGPDGLSVRRLGGHRAGEIRIGRFLVWDWPIIQPQLWSIFRALLTAGIGQVPWCLQPDGPVLQFQTGAEGDWRRGLYGLLSVPEGGPGDWSVNFSGQECDCRVFRPILAFRPAILAGNGRFVMMTWHDVDFDW